MNWVLLRMLCVISVVSAGEACAESGSTACPGSALRVGALVIEPPEQDDGAEDEEPAREPAPGPVFGGVSASSEPPTRYDGYRLMWSDEFNVDGKPDPTNWVHEIGFVRNREWQWYQEANAKVEGGLLVIEARKERVENPGFDAKAPKEEWKKSRTFAEYTSSAIETKGKHSWMYGRFEMRARIDIREGLWPAFWSVGSGTAERPKRTWPECGEIDIMEFYKRTLLANAAWGSAKAGAAAWDNVKIPIEKVAKDAPGKYASAEAWAKEFHVWRLDWTETKMVFICDGVMLNEVDLGKTVNVKADADGVKRNPLREPHYLILNLAVGATGGDANTTEMPGKFEVDWVRVYQEHAPD